MAYYIKPEDLPVIKDSKGRAVMIEAREKAMVGLDGTKLGGPDAFIFGLCEIIGELRERIEHLENSGEQPH
jgi:hypothetical protein